VVEIDIIRVVITLQLQVSLQLPALRRWSKSSSLAIPVPMSPYHLTYVCVLCKWYMCTWHVPVSCGECVPSNTPQPATNCSTQFPVLNYTVSIEGLEGSLTVEDASDYSSALSVVLSSSAFPELVQDQQYSITITACTTFTCRSPPDALLAGEYCTHI